MREGGFEPATIDFGPLDHSYSGAWVGSGIELAERRRSYFWPYPNLYQSGWSIRDWPVSQWGTTELTHGYVYGSRRTSFFVTDTSSIVGIDVDQANGTFPAGPPGTTRKRPTTLYDFEHGLWWLAAVNPDTSIALFRSPDRVTWTSLGILQRPSGTSSYMARTRFPVGLAYEPTTDRVVIAWTNFANGSWSNCGSNQVLCAHELHTALLAWNATSAIVAGQNFTRWESASNPANTSTACVGGPAVVCSSPDAAGRNCEILCVGFTPDRIIGYTRFTASSTGIANRYGPFTLGGYTDDAISLEVNGAGIVSAAVSGLNSSIWFNSKVGIGGTWTGWSMLSGPIVSKKGPLLRSTPESSFDLVTFPN